MSATTADNLRDLHELHQRAKALRDRLSSGPKTLAVRQTTLASRMAQVELDRKALQDSKVQAKKQEHSLQVIENKIDDLKTKLNLVKKNDEYKALQNQIAHEASAKSKVEEEILVYMQEIETRTAALAKLEVEAKRFGGEVAALQQQIDNEAIAQKAQLAELETAIIHAEDTIPEEYRVQYRRIVGRYGADALAICEDGSCHGCFTSLTPQMVNDLMNGAGLSFCLSCGRLLYLAEPVVVHTRRRTTTS
jgi:predicted  nucleic acid-binding Zn-ribbon protein